MKIIISYKNRYRIVEKYMLGNKGKLLDIGARDKILIKYLDLNNIDYMSADISGDHDYLINLDQAIEFPNRTFDYVVALDVLEHLENIHIAIAELFRITNKELIVSFPALSSLPRRLLFLFYGQLGTNKYSLFPEQREDRHRWFTIYPQVCTFIETNSVRFNFKIDKLVLQLEPIFPGIVGQLILFIRMVIVLIFHNYHTSADRCVFFLSRNE